MLDQWRERESVKVMTKHGAEVQRLQEDASREKNWKRWGPYLSERQWGTVREDYSKNGTAWDFFPHEQARSRAYRWGEDGLLGITDRQCRLCFALALWNEKDPILKERLFGLTGPEGNHGEDVKECYYYLDSTPTHSYLKGLYKYPQAAFPYEEILEVNRRRGKGDPEFELTDTGVFDEGRYFDVMVEYAKGAPNDILIRISVTNQGPEPGVLHLLPTLWFRNTWVWGCRHEGCERRPQISRESDHRLAAEHESLGTFFYEVDPEGESSAFLFTENETNQEGLFGEPNAFARVKDAFHETLIAGREDAASGEGPGTKAAAHYRLEIPAGETAVLKLRLYSEGDAPGEAFGKGFEKTFEARIAEANAFYAARLPEHLKAGEPEVMRQAYAGLLWTKQFYHYIVQDWLKGDPEQPAPPSERRKGRNHDWDHVYCRDVISMPDKWEYPWFAAWDLAFHMIPFARIDPEFAKEQMLLFLREWYMHPNGAIPAYEFAFSDVNPPVHAWACWRIYKMTGPRGSRDRVFLARAFNKLMLNFTWWVNRKDAEGNHLFAGGFLGLDNIGVFDRSKPLPTGGQLDQADGTAWMAFYCGTMLSMALELACGDPAYEDIAYKFFRHFIEIVDAMNTIDGTGLWDEEDGFYYDHLRIDGKAEPMKIRSLVGLIPLIAVEVLDSEAIKSLPDFSKRVAWFLKYRGDLARHITYLDARDCHDHRLLAIPSRERLERVLTYLLDENEFLSPYGIRSLSRYHENHPYVTHVNGEEYRVPYTPGESDSYLFGGNSNWRGPIWFPINYLLIEALERYHFFYGDSLKVECPTGSGQWMTLGKVSREIERRLAAIFAADEAGRRPYDNPGYPLREDPDAQDLHHFFEYFHADTGRGLGASHQTGWTALINRIYEKKAAGPPSAAG